MTRWCGNSNIFGSFEPYLEVSNPNIFQLGGEKPPTSKDFYEAISIMECHPRVFLSVAQVENGTLIADPAPPVVEISEIRQADAWIVGAWAHRWGVVFSIKKGGICKQQLHWKIRKKKHVNSRDFRGVT